eukprot:6216962-Lingulodinium_polyedra.AAC.1
MDAIFHRPLVSPPPWTIERGLVASAVGDFPKGYDTRSSSTKTVRFAQGVNAYVFIDSGAQ